MRGVCNAFAWCVCACACACVVCVYVLVCVYVCVCMCVHSHVYVCLCVALEYAAYEISLSEAVRKRQALALVFRVGQNRINAPYMTYIG